MTLEDKLLKEFDKEYRKEFPQLSDIKEDIDRAEKTDMHLATNMQFIKDFLLKAIKQAKEEGIDKGYYKAIRQCSMLAQYSSSLKEAQQAINKLNE